MIYDNHHHNNNQYHHHHHHHHHHHYRKQMELDQQEEYFYLSQNERELERIEKQKKQQLSRIVSESKLKHSSLSRSTSFEEIDHLVREGMMKKHHQQLVQSKLSKSFTHDNLFMADHSPKTQIHPLKKSHSLNQIMIKKKYNAMMDPEGRKALLNASLMNSQKQKEKSFREFPRSISTNKFSPSTSPLKFENNTEETLPVNSNGGVTFKELSFSYNSNQSNSPRHDSPSEFDTRPTPITIETTTNADYPTASIPSECSVVMMNGIDIYPLASATSNGQASSSYSPMKNTPINRTMSVSSINNYNFNDINEYNSYFMETNNIRLSPSFSMNGSYSDINNNTLSTMNSYNEFPSTEPLLLHQHDTNLPPSRKGSSKENSNGHGPNNTTNENQIVLSEVWNKWLIVISTTICPLFITLILSKSMDKIKVINNGQMVVEITINHLFHTSDSTI